MFTQPEIEIVRLQSIADAYRSVVPHGSDWWVYARTRAEAGMQIMSAPDNGDHVRRRHHARKNEGKCGQCGEKTGGGLCARCRARYARLEAARRNARRAVGQCRDCPRSAVEGRTLCRRHLDAARDRRRAAYGRRTHDRS